jgi:hypothetical protein
MRRPAEQDSAEPLAPDDAVVFDQEAVYVMNEVDPEGVLFLAYARGRSYKCIVTRLALSEHCSASSLAEHHYRHRGEQECLARFEAHRSRIYDVAERLIRQKDFVAGKVLITTSLMPEGSASGEPAPRNGRG